MRILHICGDFFISPVHLSLYKELDALGVEQIVFSPTDYRDKNRELTYYQFKCPNSKIIYSRPLRKFHSYLYGLKIHNLVKQIEASVDMSTISLINTSLVCKEGAVAYKLSQKYGIKYVTSIRNTDLNFYFKYYKWRVTFFEKVMQSASTIICISKMYSRRVAETVSKVTASKIENKLEVIYNGVNQLYIENRFVHPDYLGKPIKLVYTGGFQRNKNILNVIEAIKLLRAERYDIEFFAIGKNLKNHVEPDYLCKVEKVIQPLKWVHALDAQPKEKLMLSLREYDIFTMLSHTETFGLSYVEALSQGLPIIYSKGEGFDDIYPDGLVGYHANSRDVNDIAHSIEKAIKNYLQLKDNVDKLDMSIFEWPTIAKKYYTIFNQVVNNIQSSCEQ